MELAFVFFFYYSLYRINCGKNFSRILLVVFIETNTQVQESKEEKD